MPLIRTQGRVSVIDWIYCFLGMISCDFNGKHHGQSSSIQSLSSPVTPANLQYPDAVKAFSTCGGTAQIQSISIDGCMGGTAPCALPYGDTARLHLAYQPTAYPQQQPEINIAVNGVAERSPVHDYRKTNVEDELITLDYNMQFGKDMVGEDVNVNVQITDGKEVVLCALMDVVVVDPAFAVEKPVFEQTPKQKDETVAAVRGKAWKGATTNEQQQPPMAEDL